jgi:hypothetical protein
MKALPFRKPKHKIGLPPGYRYQAGDDARANDYDSGRERTIIETYDGITVEDAQDNNTTTSSSNTNLFVLGAVAVGLFFLLKK